MDGELQMRLARLEEEFAAARARWAEERAALLAEIARLEAENRRLREKLAEVERAGARQAAPFRRNPKKRIPAPQQKKPGRQPGHAGANRPVPDHLDEQVEVPRQPRRHLPSTRQLARRLPSPPPQPLSCRRLKRRI
jgi:hypothetical protein